MAVTVIRGVSGSPTPSNNQAQNGQVQAGNSSSQVVQNVAHAAAAVQHATQHALSDPAVVNALKSSKSAHQSEKLKNYDEARDKARDVAEKIREDDLSVEVHDDLSSLAAREHLSQ